MKKYYWTEKKIDSGVCDLKGDQLTTSIPPTLLELQSWTAAKNWLYKQK